jgi:hypothetical protein
LERPVKSNAILLLFLLPGFLPGATEDTSQPEFLTKVREVNRLAYSDLESFICGEQIKRYRGPLGSDKAQLIDTITANLSYVSGVERYTDIRQNRRPRPSLASFGGAWSQGEFGTLLQQTVALLGSQPVKFERPEDVAGTPASLFSFSVGAAESPWELHIEDRAYPVPFRTQVWVDSATGHILKILRRGSGLPAEAGVSALEWTVTLGSSEIGGKHYLLPHTARYEAQYSESGRREWNEMEFSDYHRYSVDVALAFGPVR